jgi:hypothetical protein
MKTSTSTGCLGLVILFAAIAVGADRLIGANVHSDFRLWIVLAAALLLTLGLGSIWALLTGHGRGHDSRDAIMRRVAEGRKPTQDGPTIATGVVHPIEGSLRAPISGVECVAYFYRMYYLTRAPRSRGPQPVPVYWGMASRPFRLDSATLTTRVIAVPQLADAAQKHKTPDAIQRAQEYVKTTKFKSVPGSLGPLDTALQLADHIRNNEDGKARQDWKRAEVDRDPGELTIEETVLPVGVTASVAGPFSMEHNAIVSASEAVVGKGVTAVTGLPEQLLALDTVVPQSLFSYAVTALILLALGAGVLWLAANYFPVEP